MEARIDIASTISFELREALLVYRCDRNKYSAGPSAFVTSHMVAVDGNGSPSLGAGTALTQDDLLGLVERLMGQIPVEFLPGNVLVRTTGRILWWTPPSTRPMFYSADRDKEVSQLTGHRYPQPGLIFRTDGNSLDVRALAGDRRPEPDTVLYRAPYWNVSDKGSVCLGTARVPASLSIDSVGEWEKGFFESEFTHPNAGQQLVRHPQGFVGLWKSLLGTERFPDEHLAEAGETLQQFIQR